MSLDTRGVQIPNGSKNPDDEQYIIARLRWNSPLKVAHPLGYISLLQEDLRMGGIREKPEDIVLKLRQVEVLQGQGKPLADTVRQIGATVQP